MVTPSAGKVVLVPFPFSDLSKAKLRPVVMITDVGRGDWILCQVTSKPYSDRLAVQLDNADFKSGSLQRISYARPGKLFTANTSLIVGEVGILKAKTFRKIIDAVIDTIRKPITSE